MNALSSTAAETLATLRDDFTVYAPHALWIKSKAGTLEPLQLNAAQRHVHGRLQAQLADRGRVRAIILKGRQQGMSTYTEARFFHRVSMNPGVAAYILTHRDDATAHLFDMSKRYYDLLPEALKPSTRRSNAKELEFDRLMSNYRVATAGGKGAGRSSTIQLFHGSEVGFWPNARDHLAGVGQALPIMDGTEAILESTANGRGNVFHELWQEACSEPGGYEPIFVPWFWQPEYRLDVPEGFGVDGADREYMDVYRLDLGQMAWRAYKLRTEFLGDVALFDQEYPASAELAFLRVEGEPFIAPTLVAKARAAEYEARGALVMGVDPAEMGEDATAIAFRRGRFCEPVATWHKRDTMEVAGIAANLITQREPDAVFVDAVGIGSGVYARLVELFPRLVIHRVMSGERANEDDKYVNRRAEMWGKLREWLEDGAQVPDDDGLHGELCSVQWGFDSSARIRLEKKEQMKKRGLHSPDRADALALTFAAPVQAKREPEQKSWREKLKTRTRRSWTTA